jgi:pyruvate dehydrogenase E2 component (dihydrolipoyllysine-residue acetyltransferase)
MSGDSTNLNVGDELERPSAMRKAIAAGMSLSAAVPQFTLDATVDCTALRTARDRADRESMASVSDLLIAACARTIVEHPVLNSVWTDEGILHRTGVNIATALALDEGLVVPAIQQAQARTLAAIAAERRRLEALARQGALKPDDVFTGTFTISNLGTLGIRRFRALVQPGQAAILAVGSITAGPAVVGDQLAVRPLMSLALSCDHRVVDGAPAARFLADLVGRLEDAAWLSDVLGGSPAGGDGGVDG